MVVDSRVEIKCVQMLGRKLMSEASSNRVRVVGTGDLGRVHARSNGAATTKLQPPAATKGCGSRAARSETLYKNVQGLKYHVGPVKYFYWPHACHFVTAPLYLYIGFL